MILYNTFIIIMSNKQPYLNTFTHNKTIRLTLSVFMLIKFGVIYTTLMILRIKLKQTLWKIKMHSTELNPMSDGGADLKTVYRSGAVRVSDKMPNLKVSTGPLQSMENSCLRLLTVTRQEETDKRIKCMA